MMEEMAAFHVVAFCLVTSFLLPYQPKQIFRDYLSPEWHEQELSKEREKKGDLLLKEA